MSDSNEAKTETVPEIAPKRGPGRPKGSSRKTVEAVAETPRLSPEDAKSVKDMEAYANVLGVPVESLKKVAAMEAASAEFVKPKLHVVAEPTPEEKQKQWWAAKEREARAKSLGVPVESLFPLPTEVEENWREVEAQREAADPQYAGLYHLTGGAVCMGPGKKAYAKPGTYVRLNAEDGKHITERQIGVWVKP
jgi:hypothetical protein